MSKNNKATTRRHLASNGMALVFDEDIGIGYLPVAPDAPEAIYDDAYFEKYCAYSGSDIERNINAARLKMVEFVSGQCNTICDVGIGNGSFIDEVNAEYDGLVMCYGSDVNPVALRYLEERGLLMDPIEEMPDYISMWDVIEHIDDPAPIVLAASKGILLSTPIYKDFDDITTSKHLLPNEHLWYFTDQGIKEFMDQWGMVCVHQNIDETDAGRESIGSYIFEFTSDQ